MLQYEACVDGAVCEAGVCQRRVIVHAGDACSDPAICEEGICRDGVCAKLGACSSP